MVELGLLKLGMVGCRIRNSGIIIKDWNYLVHGESKKKKTLLLHFTHFRLLKFVYTFIFPVIILNTAFLYSNYSVSDKQRSKIFVEVRIESVDNL